MLGTRRLFRPLGLAIVAALFVAAALSSGSLSALHADPLQGTWETSAVPVRTLRATLVRSGYSAAQITSFLKFFGMKNAWRNRLVFYHEGSAPFMAMSGWDPTKRSGPAEPDHGPYRLLSNHRFVARGVDPPTDQTRQLFSYSVTPKSLNLRFVSLKEPYPQFSKVDLFRDTMLMRIVAAFPYHRVS